MSRILLLFRCTAIALAVYTITACRNADSDDIKACRSCAEQFSVDFYNLRFSEAAQWCTPESQKWLRFRATNLHEGDLQLVDSAVEEAGVRIGDFTPVDDTTYTVRCTVSNFLQPDTVGKRGHIQSEETVTLTLVKRRGFWKVKLTSIPR
jgi:hypothetical protein